MKPIVKWAGGKTQLLGEITKRMPKDFETYYEPFVGGGALFFAVAPRKAVINDLNKQLMNCYRQVGENLDKMLPLLDTLASNNSEEYYYEKRAEFNERNKNGDEDYINASLMLYLNKAGYNGMYRENTNGDYNIPYGHRKKLCLYEPVNIQACSDLLKNTVILNGDFEEACSTAKCGDFVFIDSPYYSTFDTYQAGGFSKEAHIRVAEMVKRLTKKHVYCMVTNSNEDFIKELYSDDAFIISEVNVRYLLGSKNKNKMATEVIITNYDEDDEFYM